MTTTINSWNPVDGGTKHVIGCSQTCAGCSTVRECQRIAAECPNLAPVADSQHARDSAELRRLCQARDDARRERDRLAAEVADLRAQLEAVGAGGVSGRLIPPTAHPADLIPPDSLFVFPQMGNSVTRVTAQPAEREYPEMNSDERRTTIINSLRSSKSWTTDYATAFVDDYFESITTQPAEPAAWHIYAPKKPTVRRLSFKNDITTHEKSNGCIAVPLTQPQQSTPDEVEARNKRADAVLEKIFSEMDAEEAVQQSAAMPQFEVVAIECGESNKLSRVTPGWTFSDTEKLVRLSDVAAAWPKGTV